MTPAEYWQEAVEIALEEMGQYHIVEGLTADQRAELGVALAVSHECYGMAFYSPPSSDRINEIERGYKAKIARLEAEAESYRETVSKTVGRLLNQNSDARISINDDGEVYRHGGRDEQIA